MNKNIYVGSARRDERGKYVNGAAGDQDGVEVSTQKYYVHSLGWKLLRPKTKEHADLIAKYMLRACNNKNIGYDQNNRLGIIKYGTNTKTKTECDCSSLVRQVVKEATGKDPGNFTTANEATILSLTGLFEPMQYVTTKTELYNGDVLVTKSKGHTVVVTSGRERASKKEVYNMPTVKQGSKGLAVKIVQLIVGAKTDGDFGKETLSLVKQFQKDHKLTVDGVVGKNTWKVLLESV